MELTAVDENSQTTTTAYSDPYFWRPASVTDQTGAVTNFCYAVLSAGTCPTTTSENEVEIYLNFNSGNSAADSLTTLDGLGRVHVQQTRQSPSSSNFDSAETDYDSLGPPGRVVQQSVDSIGRLCEVAPTTTGCGTASSPFATGLGYSAAGQMTGFKYGNGIYASFGFSADRLQLNCLDYSTTNRGNTCTHDSTTKFGLSYSYPASPSNNGLFSGITDSVEPGRTASYTYDSLYRLVTAQTAGSSDYPAWGLSETYDRYGNRPQQAAIAGTCVLITCPQPSVTISTTTNRLVGSPYAYDASGNMTEDGINTLVYDAENHVTSSTSGSGSGTYTYDGNGRRVEKVGGGNTIVTIFAGLRFWQNTITVPRPLPPPTNTSTPAICAWLSSRVARPTTGTTIISPRGSEPTPAATSPTSAAHSPLARPGTVREALLPGCSPPTTATSRRPVTTTPRLALMSVVSVASPRPTPSPAALPTRNRSTAIPTSAICP